MAIPTPVPIAPKTIGIFQYFYYKPAPIPVILQHIILLLSGLFQLFLGAAFTILMSFKTSSGVFLALSVSVTEGLLLYHSLSPEKTKYNDKRTKNN